LEIILGIALTSLFIRRLPNRTASVVFVFSLGTIVGICSMGILYGLLVFFIPSVYSARIFIETCLTVVLVLAAYKKKRYILKHISLPSKIHVADLVLIICCALCFGLFLKFLCLIEHGANDAWAIWNVKARTLAATNGDVGAILLNGYPHSDYPLLLPYIHARHFQMAGSLSTVVPRITALMFYAASVGLFASFVTMIKNRLTGRIALVVICLSIYLPVLYVAQYADGYVSTLLLALFTTAWFSAGSEKNGSRVSPVLCGIFTGALVMTKNEGLLLSICFMLGYAAYFIRKNKTNVLFSALAKIFTGACIFLILYCAIKLCYPVKNDLVSLNTHNRFTQLLDMSRYRIIFTHFLKEIFNWHWMFLPVILWILPYKFGINGLCREKCTFVVLIPLAIAWAGYTVIYLITPYTLEWHIITSLDRLVCHLMPSFLLSVFIISNPVDKTGIISPK
jgi:hypothetical protein